MSPVKAPLTFSLRIQNDIEYSLSIVVVISMIGRSPHFLRESSQIPNLPVLTIICNLLHRIACYGTNGITDALNLVKGLFIELKDADFVQLLCSVIA
jgi:hypothetical protein